MTASNIAKLKLTVAMLIFGTIGVFVRGIGLPSSMIALVRGGVGALFLLALVTAKGKRLSAGAIRKNLVWLVISGVFIGFNWILLFESYRYTTVATSTLCYYMAPILVILVSPLALREKLTGRKLICVLVAMAGMVCISGVLQNAAPTQAERKGIFFGLAAALLYACVILMNKRIRDVPAFDKTIVQLGAAAAALVPYCLLTVSAEQLNVTAGSVLLLLLVGILHTGVAYYLYFGAMEGASGQTVAIISYIDPVIAVLASVVILREEMQLFDGLGALLILGAAGISELPERKGGVHHDN